EAGDLHPEYYVLRVEDFDQIAKNPLDEWISFLKTGHIPEDAKAPGLSEARERLKLDRMDKAERASYNAHTEALRYQRSVIQTSLIEGETKGKEDGIAEGLVRGRAEGIAEGIAKGRAEEKAEIVKKSNKAGLTGETIADITGLTIEEINAVLNDKAE
ncbi:MAG: hypothetical protein LBJ23_01460, partial [Tannerella sp.]|nr:hypothetical protein [Tannerella sp.]